MKTRSEDSSFQRLSVDLRLRYRRHCRMSSVRIDASCSTAHTGGISRPQSPPRCQEGWHEATPLQSMAGCGVAGGVRFGGNGVDGTGSDGHRHGRSSFGPQPFLRTQRRQFWLRVRRIRTGEVCWWVWFSAGVVAFRRAGRLDERRTAVRLVGSQRFGYRSPGFLRLPGFATQPGQHPVGCHRLTGFPDVDHRRGLRAVRGGSCASGAVRSVHGSSAGGI